jgi:uncharacterized protein YneF (UPF0154 family)
MKQNPRMEEQDVDRLVATYGKKPATEQKQALQEMLVKEKGKFLGQAREQNKERNR